MVYDPTKYAGAGAECIEETDLGLPILNIIQTGSAEFDTTNKKHEEKKIEGCQPGDVFLISKRMLVSRPISFVPIWKDTLYVEWKSRNSGGGFVGTHQLTIAADVNYTKEGNKEFLGDNELHYTTYFFGIVKIDEETFEKVVIPFKSTQLKKARTMSAMINQFMEGMGYAEQGEEFAKWADVKPSFFARSFRLNTKLEDKGDDTWFGWNIDVEKVLHPEEDGPLLELAAISQAEAKVSLPMNKPKELEASDAADVL